MLTGELQTTLHAAVIAQFVMHTVLLLRIGTCDQRVMRITVLGGFLPCCLDGERSLLAGFRGAASARGYYEYLRCGIPSGWLKMAVARWLLILRHFFRPPSLTARPRSSAAICLAGGWCAGSPASGSLSLLITETEAYLGPHDLACHAACGRTARSEALYGPPGTFYIYLVYGLYWMLNIVTGPAGYPAAVLIRGASAHSGPGKLARALAKDGALNGRPAAPQSGVRVAHLGRCR
jgi:DNA-3-methyladenine glycosylase